MLKTLIVGRYTLEPPLCESEMILLSTHNFYEELVKNIFQLSSATFFLSVFLLINQGGLLAQTRLYFLNKRVTVTLQSEKLVDPPKWTFHTHKLVVIDIAGLPYLYSQRNL